MGPEKSVQNSILRYLGSLEKEGEPIFFERRQAGGYSYKKGIPDVYCVYYGLHIEIEVKRPGGELSVMQEKFRDKCEKLNIIWVCAEKLDDVKNILQNIKKYLHSIKNMI